jgi:hypothetical protein
VRGSEEGAADQPVTGRRAWDPPVVGAVAGTAAGLVVVAPWLLSSGSLLVRDLVAVAVPPGLGLHLLQGGVRLARDVPGEVLAAAAGQLVGGAWVARLVLVGAFGALGLAVGRILVDRNPAAVVVAAVAAVANPWTWAHLQQGQWLVVVAYAAVAFVALAAAAGDGLGTARAVAAGAVSGVVAVVVVWPTLVVAALVGRHLRTLAMGAAVAVVTALPWLLLPGPTSVDPDGFAAFAANADTPLGIAASLVSGGGFFNASVSSPWRDLLPIALVATIVAVAALVRIGVFVRRDGPAAPRNAAAGLLVTGLVGWGVAALGATSPGLAVLREVATVVPAIAVVRDTHRLLAPLVLASALGLGMLVDDLVARRSLGPGRAGVGMAVVGVALVVVLLPDPVVGPRLPGPASLPVSWTTAATAIDASSGPGGLLVVPYSQVQRYDFTPGRPVAVPWRRLVDRPVLVGSDLVVDDLVVDDGVRDEVWADLAAQPPAEWSAAEMAAAGVAWVVVTDPGMLAAGEWARVSAGQGFHLAVGDADLVALRVDAPGVAALRPAVGRWILWLDLCILVAVLVLALPWRRRDSDRPGRYHPLGWSRHGTPPVHR